MDEKIAGRGYVRRHVDEIQGKRKPITVKYEIVGKTDCHVVGVLVGITTVCNRGDEEYFAFTVTDAAARSVVEARNETV